MHVARVLANINLTFRIDLDAIRVDVNDIVREIVKVHKHASVGECRSRSDFKLQQAVPLGFHNVKNLAVL